MKLRRNSVRTQGGCQLKNIKTNFKLKLTRKHIIEDKNLSNAQLTQTGNIKK